MTLKFTIAVRQINYIIVLTN